MRKKINKYLKGLFFSIVFGLIALIVISLFSDWRKIIVALQGYPINHILIAMSFIGLGWFLEALAIVISLLRVKRISFWYAFKTSMVTQLFNLLTPFYSGGQPFAVYYLSKNGINYKDSIASIVLKSVLFQIMMACGALISFINLVNYLSKFQFYASLLGILLNAGFILITLLVFMNKNLATNFGFLLAGFLKKIRVIKDLEKSRNFVSEKAEELNTAFIDYKRTPIVNSSIFGIYIIQYFLYVSSAVVILSGFDLAYSMELFYRVFLMNISTAIVPTPGTSGGAEGLFVVFLRGTSSKENITAAMMLWRLCTYYFSLLITGIMGFYFISSQKENGEISQDEAIGK